MKKVDEGDSFAVDIQYSENLQLPSQRFTFCAWKNKNKKAKKLFAYLHDKNKFIIHIMNLKQSLSHWVILKKVHRVFKLNQKAWLKSTES